MVAGTGIWAFISPRRGVSGAHFGRLRLLRLLFRIAVADGPFSESSFNDGTAQNGTRPPVRSAGSHHLKRLVYGGLGLGLILSEMSEGLVGSEWLLVGIGAIKELRVSV